ncbi:MAG: mandelate racemase/muconate lactonizing enzyme family protein, partial [Armatimonadetes bacterium]|nr:mandelate racemase/muconate lactonizing enzyme family protein [Armatimonadota bacterium]
RRRIQAVQSAMGGDVKLLVDANQSLSLAEAMRRGRVYEDLGCAWFEEPLSAHDHEGLAELAHALTIPVATGENDSGATAFKDLLTRKGVDIVQADLRRAGGATEILEIGALAAAFGKPYASHGGGVPDLHLLACIPTAIYAELGLLGPGSRVTLEDGCVRIPSGPGFSWD